MKQIMIAMGSVVLCMTGKTYADVKQLAAIDAANKEMITIADLIRQRVGLLEERDYKDIESLIGIDTFLGDAQRLAQLCACYDAFDLFGNERREIRSARKAKTQNSYVDAFNRFIAEVRVAGQAWNSCVKEQRAEFAE